MKDLADPTRRDMAINLSLDPERIGTALHLRYTLGVNAVVSRIQDQRGWPAAEVVIEVDNRMAPESRFRSSNGIKAFRGRVSLSSMSNKKDVWKTCHKRVSEIDEPTWEALIEDICDRAISTTRERVRSRPLGKEPNPREKPRYKVFPFLPHGQSTLLWGEADIGKSWFALYMTALADNGILKSGIGGAVGRSMYLDYETDFETMNERCFSIKEGLKNDGAANDWTPEYFDPDGRLVDIVDDVKAEIDRKEIDFVIIDSVGLALGGDYNDGGEVIKFYRAVRDLGTTTLLIDHSGKDRERGAIGSTYKTTGPRSVWEMRRTEAAERVTIGLYHRKANNSQKSAPIGLTLDILSNNDGIAEVATFERFNLIESAELAEGLPLSKRISAALKEGALTVEEISDRIPDVTYPTLKKALSRGVGKAWIRLEHGRYGIQHQAAI